jgi:heptosyltransferase III
VPLLERIPSGARIAVIRLRSLGDCVLTTPALTLLKAHRPDLQVAVVVEDRFAPVFEGNPDLDEILPPSKTALFRWRPDAAINFHGGTRSMALTLASAAKIRSGFAQHAYSFLYSDKIPRAQEILGEDRPVHTAEHLASAMFWMGVPRTEIPRARLSARPTATAPPASYLVVHPFASHPDKAWPAANFIDAAERICAKTGWEPVFLAGPGDDASPFKGFTVLQEAPLAQVKSLVAGATAFLGNDSGPAHIAAAFGIRTVVLFGPSNPVTWAPWRTEASVLTSTGPISAISVAEVVSAFASGRGGGSPDPSPGSLVAHQEGRV